jgi:N-acetylneuraminic acid mutarotase
LLGALLCHPGASQPLPAASFTNTGSLTGPRAGHTATLLTNGIVLVAGGYQGGNPLASSEIYDPAKGLWTVAAALHTGRTRHTATLLPNGKVLVAGGGFNETDATPSCELYNPADGTWTSTGSMKFPRVYHSAVLLLNGKVLVACGSLHRLGDDIQTAELYDPATGTWAETGGLSATRDEFTATLLMNGKVLVTGVASVAKASSSTSSAELFDPISQTWALTGSMNSARQSHRAVLLANGRVLVSGGLKDGNALTSTEEYDPNTGTWQALGALTHGRAFHSATLLPDGKVLAAGGVDSSSADLSSAELFDPSTETWTTVNSLSVARNSHSATLLPNGNVLVVGGGLSSAPVWFADAELYDSVPGPVRLLNPVKAPGGNFQFAFTGAPQAGYVALLGESPLPPDPTLFGWHYLGIVPEFATGLFVFSGPPPAMSRAGFYRVSGRLAVFPEDLPCLQAGSGFNPCPNCMACNGELWVQFATCREPCPGGW